MGAGGGGRGVHAQAAGHDELVSSMSQSLFDSGGVTFFQFYLDGFHQAA